MEIFLATFFIVISYNGIKENNLSESALIASNSNNYPIQYVYGRNTSDILAYRDLLDRGTLTLRNPNKIEKIAKIDLIINGDVSNIGNLKIDFDGKVIDSSSLISEDGKYTLPLGKIALKSFANREIILSIYGDPFKDTVFSYNLTVNESSN